VGRGRDAAPGGVPAASCADELGPATLAFYRGAMDRLARAGIPVLVGGAFGLERYAGISRGTKDLDLFVAPLDFDRTLDTLRDAGFHATVAYPHWLGKAYRGDDFIDIIFSSGNGVATVDDGWFVHAVDDEVLGLPARICPPEETIWSKAFIMERERYDGADIAHILRACADRLDWHRLLRRFGRHWRVLLSHLVLFGFIYPGERRRIPDRVLRALLHRLEREQAAEPPGERVCEGTVLSREQYLTDIDRWGYRDGRLVPRGTMTESDTALWTAAIDKKE
jgi:hypothetical protein